MGAAATDDAAESTHVYRPHLDGLRAVAVYLVVVFHAGSDRFAGGYIGVDVFFVLSGFLVTQLLAARHRRQRFDPVRSLLFAPVPPIAPGRVRHADRHRASCTPQSRHALEVADAVGSFKAAFLYSANWYFIHQSHGLLRRRHLGEPGVAFLVAGRRGAVLPALAAGAGRAVPAHSPARSRRIGCASYAWSSQPARWLRRPGRCRCARRTRLGPTTGPTPARYELLAGALLALVPALFASAARHRRAIRVVTTVASLARSC